MKASFSRLALIGPAFLLVLIGVASVAFAWGASGGNSAVPPAMPSGAPRANSTMIPGNPRLGPGGQAQAPVIGTVARKTDSTIVVTTLAGQTVTVDVSSTTTYSTGGPAAATLADVAVGARIAAQGTLNADGSLNATTVQTIPNGGRRGFGGGDGGGRPGGGRGVPNPAPSGSSLGPTT